MPHLTSIEEMALEKGLEKGREQGRQEGKLGIIRRQLERRLGKLTPALNQRLQSLSSDKLEVLAEALLDFHSAADLQAWLSEPQTR